MPSRSKWCLIGIPDHQGVVNVGGRIGAAGGPHAFRRALRALKGAYPPRESLLWDRDVQGFGRSVARNHEMSARMIREALIAGALPVVIGGGNDHAFPQLQALWNHIHENKSKPRIGCINIDAHFDVRKPSPEISSGSPFYLALESEILHPSRLIEFGIQSHCNSPELWDYIRSKKVATVRFDSLRGGKAVSAFKRSLSALAKKCDALVIALDLDAVAEAHAPGVSAPQAEGFTPSEIVEMMEIAGREKKVSSLGIYELNPEHDIDAKTARLAATAAYHFLQSALPG